MKERNASKTINIKKKGEKAAHAGFSATFSAVIVSVAMSEASKMKNNGVFR